MSNIRNRYTPKPQGRDARVPRHNDAALVRRNELMKLAQQMVLQYPDDEERRRRERSRRNRRILMYGLGGLGLAGLGAWAYHGTDKTKDFLKGIGDNIRNKFTTEPDKAVPQEPPKDPTDTTPKAKDTVGSTVTQQRKHPTSFVPMTSLDPDEFSEAKAVYAPLVEDINKRVAKVKDRSFTYNNYKSDDSRIYAIEIMRPPDLTREEHAAMLKRRTDEGVNPIIALHVIAHMPALRNVNAEQFRTAVDRGIITENQLRLSQYGGIPWINDIKKVDKAVRSLHGEDTSVLAEIKKALKLFPNFK